MQTVWGAAVGGDGGAAKGASSQRGDTKQDDAQVQIGGTSVRANTHHTAGRSLDFTRAWEV